MDSGEASTATAETPTPVGTNANANANASDRVEEETILEKKLAVETFPSACGRCAKAFTTTTTNGNEDEKDGKRQKRVRQASRVDDDVGAICAACYQKEYYRKCKNSSAMGPCGRAECRAERTTGYWHRSQVGAQKGMRICQRCYVNEKRERDVGNPAIGIDGNTTCAKCDKATPGSAKDYWYRAQEASISGKRICKACHLIERRARLNADPDVFCCACKRTELTSTGWRKNKNGGYWCDRCYKANRLQIMNEDPNVQCGQCRSGTSGGPEWRKSKDGSWLCRSCLSDARSSARREIAMARYEAQQAMMDEDL